MLQPHKKCVIMSGLLEKISSLFGTAEVTLLYVVVFVCFHFLLQFWLGLVYSLVTVVVFLTVGVVSSLSANHGEFILRATGWKNAKFLYS